MVKINYRSIFRILFYIWIILWLNFIARDLIKKRYFNDYRILLSCDEASKRSYIYGDDLFEFIDFCKDALPKSSNYNFISLEKPYLESIDLEEPSLEYRRAIYYLYPHIKKKKADFLLVFNKPGFRKKEYTLYKRLDNFSFILRRR